MPQDDEDWISLLRDEDLYGDGPLEHVEKLFIERRRVWRPVDMVEVDERYL